MGNSKRLPLKPQWLAVSFFLFTVGLFTACTQNPALSPQRQTVSVQLTVDGSTQEIRSNAKTVREFLVEQDVELAELDELTPPNFTPLTENLQITVVRVTESLDIIQQTIPFERKFVRSESMNEDDPPVILQAGEAGLQETTWRIVYRDGLEAERWPTNTVVLEAAKDEIVRIGIGASRGNITFSGLIAYISDGTGVMLRNATAFPESINTGGRLDGRVFSLSPSGSHLLYTRTTTETNRFNNSLWVVGTERSAAPRPLGVENVLWADWNPNESELRAVAYTTARPTDAPPGWEANNDLWLGNVFQNNETQFTPTQIVEAYPATYGWWGGNYAWSPNGRFIAYSFADEVGVLTIDALSSSAVRNQLQRFTEYNTLSNWVWVPTLSWSADSRFLLFTNHGSEDSQAQQFDSWIVDIETGASGRLLDQTGMWGHVRATSVQFNNGVTNGRIAYLRAIDPIDSQRSNYTLWLMDQDGSNTRQIYPSVGENSRFPRTPQFMAWGPSGNEMTFVFDDDLYFFNLETNEAHRITQDDALISHPTWAPYGVGLITPADSADLVPIATPPSNRDMLIFPETAP